MAADKNPFAIGIPILLALAAFLAIARVVGDVNSRPERHRPRGADATLLEVVPASVGSIPAPKSAGIHGSIVGTAQDAAVVWLRWPDSRTRIFRSYLTDSDGRPFSYRLDTHIPGLVALCISRGYGDRPGDLSLKVNLTSGAESSWTIPGSNLPPAQHFLAETASTGVGIKAVPTRFRDTIGVKVTIPDKNSRASWIAARITRGSYVRIQEPKWQVLPHAGGNFEGIIDLPNAQFARAIEIELQEVEMRKASKDVTFGSANLLPETAALSRSFKVPETLSGPEGSSLSLTGLMSGTSKRRGTGVPYRWTTAYLAVRTTPTTFERELSSFPAVEASVLRPSANDLGVHALTCSIQQLVLDPVADSQTVTTASGREPGELVLRVSIGRPVPLGRRKAIVSLGKPGADLKHPPRPPHATALVQKAPLQAQ